MCASKFRMMNSILTLSLVADGYAGKLMKSNRGWEGHCNHFKDYLVGLHYILRP